MTPHPLKTLAVVIASGLGLGLCLYATASQAHAIDAQFDCHARPHAFINELIDNKFIEPIPMHVEANSVNAFRPVHGSDMTAFGFRVYAVLGYEPDDDLFRKGQGQALANPLYGAVLSGPSETVKSRVSAAGSNATVRMVVPMLLTAVVCSP